MTRGGHLGNGGREVGDDPESQGSIPHTIPLCPGNPSRHAPNKILIKIAGHFWGGKPVRSFAAAVRAESAPSVSVRMNRGGGHRGNYGTARDGFGAGQQGRGHGRTTGRNLTWERTNRVPPVQEEAIQEEE